MAGGGWLPHTPKSLEKRVKSKSGYSWPRAGRVAVTPLKPLASERLTNGGRGNVGNTLKEGLIPQVFVADSTLLSHTCMYSTYRSRYRLSLCLPSVYLSIYPSASIYVIFSPCIVQITRLLYCISQNPIPKQFVFFSTEVAS